MERFWLVIPSTGKISLLFQVGMSGGFGQDIKHCHLVDFLHFDDKNHDNSINWNEFLAAFHNFVPTGMQKKTLVHLVVSIDSYSPISKNIRSAYNN